jgi:hypothetical protein
MDYRINAAGSTDKANASETRSIIREEYQKCLVGITSVLKEARSIAENTEDNREKINTLSLAKECYAFKLDLLTNATVVDDAIRFMSENYKERLKSSTEDKKEESKEPDYDEDRDQQEEEQEEETTEITKKHIFLISIFQPYFNYE